MQDDDTLNTLLADERSARARAEAMLSEKYEELKQAKQSLEAATKALQSKQLHMVQQEKMASLGALAAGVAHEINNPVGFVLSNTNALKQYLAVYVDLSVHAKKLVDALKSGDDGAAQAHCTAIERLDKQEDLSFIISDIADLFSETEEGLARVKDIVSNLKNFARVDEAEWKEADIHDGIEATLKILANQIKYNCHVVKNFGDLPNFYCYPGQLNQVFMNLILNASQAIEEKGTITITTKHQGEYIFISIADTGSGIPAEKLSHIFDPFYTTKPVGQGTGLGLSISHSIVENHKGALTVDSELGHGTVFNILLPITEEQPQHYQPA